MRLTAKAIFDKKQKGEKITALTAYDYPTARILDESGLDMILVGDSLGMVLLGYDTTLPVTMRDMLHHTKAVARAVKNAMVIADMPFGAYDRAEQALKNARRFLKEGGADGVKLEGGFRIQEQIQALIAAGIPVMGHLGMTPQSASQLGGYRVQGKEKGQADKIVKDAVLLAHLGVFALVLECIPTALANQVTQKIQCPTIGIGAGPGTDGQILVLHDMLGFVGKVGPKFVRRYAALETEIRKAASTYREDVLKGRFPAKQESF